jgi:hypothetical protein
MFRGHKIFRIPIEIFLVAAIIAINIPAIFSPANSLMNWYTSDDSFFYFKIAQNINEGKGVTFDGISRTNGFHPLWLVICIPVFALTRINLILPLRVLALISILLNAGAAIILYRLVARIISDLAGFLTALLWAFYPYIHFVTVEQGMESGISAFLILLLIYLASNFEVRPSQKTSSRQLIFISITATLVIFSRLDNIFLVAILGVWLVLRYFPNLRYLLIADIVLAMGSVLISYFLRVGFQTSYQPFIPAAIAMVGLAFIVKPAVFYLGGLYGTASLERWHRALLRLIVVVSLASILILLGMYLLTAAHIIVGFPRSTILMDWAITLASVFITRLLYCIISRAGHILPLMQPLRTLKENWMRWGRTAWQFFAIPGFTLGIYVVFSRLFFGTSLPVSGQIKQWWGTLSTVYGRPVDSLVQALGLDLTSTDKPWGLAALPFQRLGTLIVRLPGLQNRLERSTIIAGVGVFLLALLAWLIFHQRDRVKSWFHNITLFPLLAGSFLQIFYYDATNYVHMRNWYWVAEIISIILIFAILAGALLEMLKSLHVHRLVPHIGIGMLSIALGASFLFSLYRLVPMTVDADSAESYLHEIHLLENVTEPGSIIGVTGGGGIAYFIQGRTVVNLDGLMNSAEYFQLMKDRVAYRFLDRIGLDYVYGGGDMITDSEPYMFIFKDRIRKIMELGEGTVYQYLRK